MNWPIFYKNNLALGNLSSNIAICTLWTKQEKVLKSIQSDNYCLIGNLYSKVGINYIIRNVLANPVIRHIIICGADRNESGQALIDLFKNGVDEENRIVGHGVSLDKEIDKSLIDLFLSGVNVVDLRKLSSFDEIGRTIRSLDNTLPPFLPAPLILPKADPDYTEYPHEGPGLTVRGNLVAEVWLKLLCYLINFGNKSETEYDIQQKELIDIVSIIKNEDPLNIRYVDWFPFDKEHLIGVGQRIRYVSDQLSLLPEYSKLKLNEKSYYAEFLGTQSIDDFSYTYGQRLGKYQEIDQIRFLIEKIRETACSRRALAILWDPSIDIFSDNPPCLCLVQALLRDKKLIFTAYFRSHDIYRAWPENAFALLKLQKLIVDAVGECEPGDLVIISHSAHIYQDCWDDALKLIEKKSKVLAKTASFERDPRGNYSIRIEDGKVIIEHYSQTQSHLNTFRGNSLKTLQRQLAPFVSSIEHAIYLGSEIEKAIIALKLGLKYVQDQELKMK